MRLNKYATKGLVIGFLLTSICMSTSVVNAETGEKTTEIEGKVYELAEKDSYSLSKLSSDYDDVARFNISGAISSTSKQDGVISYIVDVENDDNLQVSVNTSSKSIQYQDSVDDATKWHIIEDKTKQVNDIKLNEKIGTGVLVVQTSKDHKIWVESEIITDYFLSDKSEIYKTTNVQLADGCFYRIILAYTVERTAGSHKVLFKEVEDKEVKEQVEIYEFHAINKNVKEDNRLDVSKATVLGELNRAAQAEGYYGIAEIDNEDPHNGWELGHFYINGFTDKTESADGTPIFLKEVGDRTTLWFKLDYDLDKCNGNDAIKVVADPEGSDQTFRTPIMDFGKGTLIIRKKDYNQNKTTQYYTNFLEASATPGANTRVDLFEEGDYEVALDYALEYDKTKILGKSVLPKTLHYRVSFNFSVRNGDCKLFIRDAKTKEFINNGNIAENGFFVDLAKSKYLQLLVTRDVMTDSLDGLVADTKFNGAAQTDRPYTEEGIYTIKATNRYTSATTEKKIYVGNSEILKAYMKTGLSISEINEKVAAGATITDDGEIIEKTLDEVIYTEVDETVTEEQENIIVKNNVDETVFEDEQPSLNPSSENKELTKTPITALVIILLVVAGYFVIKKRDNKNTVSAEQDEIDGAKRGEDE